MLTPQLQKIVDMYTKTMREVSIRLRLAASMSNQAITTGYRILDYETMAMSFRKIAELIILANLIGHESEYSAAHTDLNSVWNMGQLMNKLRKINPNYYPVALKAETDEDMYISGMSNLADGEWMTEQELIDMWGKCSDLLHGHNPYKSELDYGPYEELFDIWGEKIGKLISFHGVPLTNQKHIVMCLLSPIDKPNEPLVTIFENDDTNKVLVNLIDPKN